MLKGFVRYKKAVALFFLVSFTMDLVAPNVAYALTSGPAQPEMKSFEPVATSDMVDLFTGDFSYNIPLMDVGGYPLNISYSSGAGMDDEASWVGHGWTLNPGAVNRQLRGIPDDFDGTDELEKEKSIKDHITKGINLRVKVDLLGIPGLKKKAKKKKKSIRFSPSISLGVKHDNYRGIGTSLGLNVGISLGEVISGTKTTQEDGKSKTDTTHSFQPSATAGFGLNLSSMDGASTNVNFSVLKASIPKSDHSLSGSVGLSYNSRAGLQQMTMAVSFDEKRSTNYLQALKQAYWTNSISSVISFAGNTYMPTVDFPTKNTAYSLDINAGGQLQPFYLGGGITGFYTKQKLAFNKISRPAYGFLNSEKGKNDPDALMDLNREKDIPYSKDVNYLPIPVPTNDFFNVSSQVGGGQYRIYRGSTGVFFDDRTAGIADDLSLGIELGFGTYFDIGADLHWQKTSTVTQKWVDKNNYLVKGDYQASNDVLHEKAFFKRVGEPVLADKDYQSILNNTEPVAIKLVNHAVGNNLNGAVMSADLRGKNDRVYSTGNIVKNKRDIRNNNFTYLTAREASLNGFSKKIRSYPMGTLVLSNCINPGLVTEINRVDAAFPPGFGGFSRTKSHRSHHISEITVTAEDGKRMIYGIPVYNKYQEEVTFSVDADLTKRNRGIIGYNHNNSTGDNSIRNAKGRDNYFSKDKTPGYTTSFLLTEILSPDYEDLKKDGVTDDDLGTAVKFNYSKLSQDYKWRAPFDSANYNEGFLSDTKDDKANYVYGEKETWYMHSIESKTMIAQFILEDRADGLGVVNDAGGINTAVKLKRLKEIRLYSKSDLIENKTNIADIAPIKTVHFVYDYSIQKNLPNNLNTGSAGPALDSTGKLTLRKIYFTFGANQKGKLNPYEFEYNIYPEHNNYEMRQYDRWGMFKSAAANPSGLNNSEFPFTLQNKAATDSFAALWQLSRIILPSGGNINVTYESDDYGYVQDKRAAELCFISGVGSLGSSSGLITADEIFVKLPRSLSEFGNYTTEAEKKKALKYRYFGDNQYIYFKVFADLDNLGHKEFVPGYAKVLDYRLVNDSTVAIKLEKWGDEKGRATNPIAFSAWQFLRNSLPKYAYPGYENMDDAGSDFKKAIQSLLTALGNIKELVQGFSGIARHNSYCNNIELEKSWVRLQSPTMTKLGGGSRVKRLSVSDAWEDMVGSQNGQTSNYTIEYDYTTTETDEKGSKVTISSGVAAYEPLIGSEENPFHKPVFYLQKVPLFLTDYSYLEEPFCESFFPAPVVGYSRVGVKNVGASGQSVPVTGTVINEFYTAKDYPTKVEVLTLEKRKPGFEKILKLLKISIRDLVGLSQGYSVETNDMHGKPKCTTVLNEGGSQVSKIEYFYKNENELAEKKVLSNSVKLMYPDGVVKDGVIGQEIEMFSDMRDQRTENFGIRIQVSGGSGAIAIWPIPFAFPGVGPNNELRSYRAASTIKLINRFAVGDKIRRTQNGSTITTENLAWDPYTGEVLLSKTENEFDDPVYSFTYPAHWAYDGMGQAYKNIGTYLAGLTTNSEGVVTNSNYTSGPEKVLVPGDELIDINTTKKYWVVNTLDQLRLMDETGQLQVVSGITAKIIRSGRRNIADAAIATVTSLKNPVVNGVLDISVLSKVLDAKATVFKEEWSVPVQYCPTCPAGYTLTEDKTQCYKDTPPISPSTYTVCEGSQIGPYSSCGTYEYHCGTSGPVRARIAASNAFWNAFPADYTNYCNYNATNTATFYYGMSCGGSRAAAKGIQSSNIPLYKDTLSKFNSPMARNPSVRGPLNRTGIWACGPDGNPSNVWLGFAKQLNITQAKEYYLGIGADNDFRVFVDGNLTYYSLSDGNSENFKLWHIFPLFLSVGNHTLRFEAINYGGPASFGAELYNNTLIQIGAATGYAGLDTLFSTANMVGQHFTSGDTSCAPNSVLVNVNGVTMCREYIPIQDVLINPYYRGLLGNWRQVEQNTYYVDRSKETNVSDPAGRTNIRKGGVYSAFTAFWTYNSFLKQFVHEIYDENWVTANAITFHNKKGAEIENRDALNRYSSALYGYLESVPIAVSANARINEVAYDGFEDYSFDLTCDPLEGCDTNIQSHFSFKKLINASTIVRTNEEAHSGRYSLKLSGSNGASVTKQVLNSYGYLDGPVFYQNYLGQYTLEPATGIKGFSPEPGKKYIFSCWVKDGNPTSPTTNARVLINNSNYVTAFAKWQVVEEWKRIEFPFIAPISGEITIKLNSDGGSDIYYDDVRIYPFEGQMKSFAYDPSSQRLLAEMDENNFGTFYEYDDEGILIRVKKETDRGIMTIRETRSSLKKRAP
jgi:hypothetical protein